MDETTLFFMPRGGSDAVLAAQPRRRPRPANRLFSCKNMPPIRNVALRDTLASLGELRSCHDTMFAAHEVPCDIDYQLSEPVDANLLGLDYIEAWLAQLLKETRWIARFDVGSCITVLERTCPDYRGLHVNLYDLLLPHESELDQMIGGIPTTCMNAPTSSS